MITYCKVENIIKDIKRHGNFDKNLVEYLYKLLNELEQTNETIDELNETIDELNETIDELNETIDELNG